MDFRVFDRARRQVGPLQLDLVESYAKGILPRREFVRRGTVIGLSLPFISAIISACGSDDDGGSSGSAGTGGGDRHRAGRHHRRRVRAPAAPSRSPARSRPALDPVAMQDLGSYGLVAQCFEFLVTLGENGDIAPGLAESLEPNDDGSVWTFNLRQGVKWQDGTDFTSADVAATMDRLVAAGNSGLKGVIEEGAVDTSDPNVAVFTLAGPNGNFPYLVSVFNAQSVITPVDYESGTTLDGTPNGTGPWKLDTLRRRHRRHVRAQRHVVGRPDPAGRHGVPVLRRPRHHGDRHAGRRGRRHRAVPGHRRRRPVQRPQLQRAGVRVRDPPPDLDALRHRPVRRQARCARRWP